MGQISSTLLTRKGGYVFVAAASALALMGPERRKYILFKIILSSTEVPKALFQFLKRRSQGHATDLLNDATNPVQPSSGYFVDMRFEKPFTDRVKFEKHFYEMVKEAGAQKKWAEVLWPETPTIAGGISDEIVPRCAEIPTLQELAHAPTYGKTFSICVVNGQNGNDSMLRCQLPVSSTYDGTSCFNFMKELISRYYDAEPNPKVFTVARQLRLSEEARSKFLANSPYTLTRFFKIWMGVWNNCDHWAWNIATIPNFLEDLQAYGLPPQFWTDENGKVRNEYRKLILNWTKEETDDLIARFKAKGMKPYSGMAFTAIKAWELTFGSLPVGMMQQASLQIRGYVPHYKERNLCGDWLVGPIHFIPKSQTTYRYQDAINMRNDLHKNLKDHNGNVLEAFESRAYGKFQAGVQQYQMCTPTTTPVFDMIWFNNYGLRTIHPDAGFKSWNWGAPFGMGFNTINVNGRISLCVASARFNMEEIERFRSNVKKITDEM